MYDENYEAGEYNMRGAPSQAGCIARSFVISCMAALYAIAVLMLVAAVSWAHRCVAEQPKQKS